MSATQTFAIDASQRLPDPNMHGEGDIVTIITLLLPVILPLIEQCLDRDQQFGAGCHQLATDAQSKPFKRLAFRIGVLRSVGFQDYRDLPGGGRECCNALIDTAAASTPEQIQQVHAECCCC